MLKNYFFIQKMLEAIKPHVINLPIKEIYTIGKERCVIVIEHVQIFIHFNAKYPFVIYEAISPKPSGSQPVFQSLIGQSIQTIAIISNSRQIEFKCTNDSLIANLYQAKMGLICESNQEFFLQAFSIDRETAIDEERALELLHIDSIDKTHLIASNKFYTYEDELSYQFSFFPPTDDKTVYFDEYTWQENYQHAFYRCLYFIRYQKLRKAVHSSLIKQFNYIKKSYEKLKSTKLDPKEKEIAEQKGHLILNNLHRIRNRSTQIDVENIFDPKLPEITIKLDSKLSAQKNAEKYYLKAKSYEKNKVELDIRIANIENRFKYISAFVDEYNEIKGLKQLEKFKKKLEREGILKLKSNDSNSKNQNYIEFQIEGYTVCVGKDAKSNDFVSLKLSKANDFWFHVQGSPGSHVILRWHGEKDNPPKSVLEKTASLAAFYSKQKNAGTVPVIYALAKHVRKPRGAAPGAVIVSKEKSIFVKPKPFEEL